MRITILKLSSVLFLVVICFSCSEKIGCSENFAEIQVEDPLKTKLDQIFSSENTCLKNFSNDTVCHIVYNKSDFDSVDNCNDISEINFGKFTLIVGKIQVGSINDSIHDIALSCEDEKYTVEIQVERCPECYAAIGNLYFWRLYPNLDPSYEKEIAIVY